MTAALRALHNDLPLAPDLVGRPVDELMKALESAPIVAVQGARGVGKTAFALTALHRFLDGEVFGALVWSTAALRKEHLKLGDILDAMSLAVNFPFRPLMSLADKEAELIKDLEQKNLRCLLLLDNYEAVTDPDIENFLFGRRPARLSVLITVSHRLKQDGILPFPLEELGEKDAAAMFQQMLARRGLGRLTDRAFTALFEVVGGNPLALEWVIGQMDDGLQLEWLVQRLKKGDADLLHRVFDQVWERLGAAERSVLAAMVIFRRPALEESLQAASGLDIDKFQSGIAALVRLYVVKTLVLEESPNVQLSGLRYFVHPFTRDYLEHLRQKDTTTTLYSQMASFYLTFVRARGGTPEREELSDIQSLNSERENILGVIEGCWSLGQGSAVVPLVEAMARWLFIESHWEDLERYGTRAAEDAVAYGNKHAAGRILNEVGRTFSHRSDFKRAAEIFSRALKLAGNKPPDSWGLAYIRHHTGEALMREKRLREARTALSKSLIGFQRIKSTRSIIGVRYRLAMLALEEGDLDGARALASRGVSDTMVENWDRLQGFNHRLLGDVAAKRKELKEAAYHYERALDLVPRSDMRIQALIELSLARLANEAGKPEETRERAVVALGHFEKMRMKREAEEARRLAEGLVPPESTRSSVTDSGGSALVDVLIATALTEENQVVHAVLNELATPTEKNGPAPRWTYSVDDGTSYTLVAVSAHSQGSVNLSGAAPDWFREIKPRCAALVGIAAAVKTKGLGLGSVPLADQVVGYGDIAVENGSLTFRNAGFQTDGKVLKAAGELRSDAERYEGWQAECKKLIRAIVPTLNKVRSTKIVPQGDLEVEDPHLVVGVTGSGPFLLRDADFRGKLAALPGNIPETHVQGLSVTGPVHPKLVSAEMEAHGFMSACHSREIPGSVLKGISDLGDAAKAEMEEKSGGFYRAYACANAVIALLHILRQRPRPPISGGGEAP
jgi:nucleoside phosphorylase/tetratricopeptide (TPR) repeat protein